MDIKKINIKNEKDCENHLNNLYDQILDYFDEDLSLWEKTKQIDGVQLYKKKNKQGKTIKREEGIINMPVKEILKNFEENESFSKNDMVMKSKKSKIHNNKFQIYWSITKSFPLFSSRELELIKKVDEQPDGSFIITGCSFEGKELEKDSIRAEVPILGWNLKEYEKDKNKTIASYLMCFELKGNVPEFVMNFINNSNIASINKGIKN